MWCKSRVVVIKLLVFSVLVDASGRGLVRNEKLLKMWGREGGLMRVGPTIQTDFDIVITTKWIFCHIQWILLVKNKDLITVDCKKMRNVAASIIRKIYHSCAHSKRCNVILCKPLWYLWVPYYLILQSNLSSTQWDLHRMVILLSQ